MTKENEHPGLVPLDPGLIAQITAHLGETSFTTVEAFVRHCVEKELKLQREAGEKALAERLRGLGYLE